MPTDRDLGCRQCRLGRPHCHGTLVRHSGRHADCTDPGCTHSEVLLHSLTIDCAAVGCHCGDTAGHRAAV